MLKGLAKGLGGALAAVVLAAVPARAAEVIVVFDGSGSSAGRIAGTPKIDIARAGLANALSAAPADLALGLAAYGHRQKDVCTDIELLAAPATDSIEAVLAAAGKIRPRGKTPIAGAIALAAGSLSDAEGKGTIVIITDGAENCDPDPCAATAALKERLPGLRVSVVGLRVSEEDAPKLACFADLTGGLYLRANDAAGFNAILAEALADAWKGEPEPPLPSVALTVPDDVEQGRPFEIGYSGPAGEGDQIRIAWVGTPPSAHLTAAFVKSDGAPVTVLAPAERGRYEVRYWYAAAGRVIASERLRVVAVAPTLAAPDRVVQGQEFSVTWTAPAVGGEAVIMAVAGEATPVARQPAIRGRSDITLTAPGRPGAYELRLLAAGQDGPVLAARPIAVDQADIRLTVPAAAIAGTPIAIAWAGPGGRYDDMQIARPDMADGDYLAAARLPANGSAAVLQAPLPAGAYELRYWSGADRMVLHRQALNLAAPSASLDAPEAVDGATGFAVAWSGPAGPGDRIILAEPAMPAVESVFAALPRLDGAAVMLSAPATPGTYELRYVAGRDAILARRTISVTAAAAALTVPGAVVAGETFAVSWQGPAAPLDEIRLTLPADDAATPLAASRLGTAGAPVSLTAPTQPGTYMVRYWSAAAGVVLAAEPVEIRCDDCAAAPSPGAAPGLAPLRGLAP